MENLQSAIGWEPFYSEFADKLLEYKNNRSELLVLLEDAYKETGLRFPFVEQDKPIDDICPFTVFGGFNKQLTLANKKAIMQSIRSKLGVQEIVPSKFDGIPLLNPIQSWFFGHKENRQQNEVNNLWNMFESAIKYADTPTERTKNDFVQWYDTVSKQYGVKWNLTIGLFWIRPNSYLNLDETNRVYLLQGNIAHFIDLTSISKLKQLPDAKTYLDMVALCKATFQNEKSPVHSFPELSTRAWDGDIEPPEPPPGGTYTRDDFLKEVFMKDTQYEILEQLLNIKKNIILQGAPGVGKTFVAKRLAYSMIREKDTCRVMMVQFHQSYSYEDFIMGFRPTENGFKLTEGPFYEFCKTAEDDIERDYFFIIDEINRGNISKIFGELLMLIEQDKRGEKLRLIYSNELFSVPPNVYIIGLMNTADRSLAMFDYALRRRFAFYEMEPAFESQGFQEILEQADSIKFTRLIKCVKELNDEIRRDESLGAGFRIGHSYFCTNEDVTDSWLSQVVNFELIPLLNEYWFDEKAKVEDWTSKLQGVLND